ncbi:MAG TPA: hypothetical protein VFT02_16370 [Pyrinomonadaceae bacterium]|nr:hypothetical protein [Pyrinomonadaceae bacterium]
MIRRKSVSFSRVVLATLVLAFGVVSANAYTIVMRDGRRVEIPDKFNLTGSTLTYQAGKDIQVTIQLNTVDVAATERANGEGAGSFLMRGSATKPVVNQDPQRPARAGRSITNVDLEPYRRARIEGEKAYEQQRVELGLPSREERRLEVAEIQDRTLEQVRHMRRQQEMEEAAYWRGRAESMRAATASQAEMDFWRSNLGAGSIVYPEGGFFPSDGFGFGVGDHRFRRFGRFPVADPFSGFLSTPITPFPRFPSTFRRGVFVAPRGRVHQRPGRRGGHGGRGGHRR